MRSSGQSAYEQNAVIRDRSRAPAVGHAIVIVAVVTIFNAMDRVVLALLAPLIKADLLLSDSDLGLLVGFAFSVFYAICGIPIGRWADRSVRRNIIALAVLIWSVMTALSGAAQNFSHLFLARVGVGVGEAGSFAPGASILCDYVPLKRRASVLAVLGFASAVGVLVGMVLAGWLGDIIGWRWTFVALGLPGVALAAIVRFKLHEPTRGAVDLSAEVGTVSLRDTLSFLWRCRTYRLIVVFLMANAFVQSGLNLWWPSFYSRVFGLSLSSVGSYLGVAIGASGAIGVLAGGFMASKTSRLDIRRPLVISAVALSVSATTALASLFVRSLLVSVLLVAVTGLLWGVSNGPVLAAQYSVVTARIRATAGALAIFMTSIFGFGLAPLSVGWVSDTLSPSMGAESLRYALLIPVIMTIVTVLALLLASRTLQGDLAAVGADVVEPGPKPVSDSCDEPRRTLQSMA